MISTTDAVIRLLISAVLAGIIGWERQTHHKSAGMRTTMMVGIGSTLLMLISLYIPELYPDNPSVDPGRIASQVVVGIGFLCAGLIIHTQQNKDEEKVHGITTAAAVWVVSAIGLAVGIGFYIPAIVVTAITLIVLYVFQELKMRWRQ